MKCIQRVENVLVEVGGEPHSGWLPENACTPNPTPLKRYTVTVELLSDGDGEDCLLCYHSTDKEYAGDFWFENIAAAHSAALDWFGINPTDWTTLPA